MMPPETVSLEFLARQQAQLLEELKAARSENREVRRSFSLISDHFSRQERRIGELREDFETMLKLEIGGAIANLETRLENSFAGHINVLQGRLDGVEGKLNGVEAQMSSLESKLDAILLAVTRA